MCNCYGHFCNVKDCEEIIPMHIGDFKYLKEDFECYCKKHLDKAPKGSIIFHVIKNEFMCAILGPEVGGKGYNHPNIAGDIEETIIT